MSFAFLLVKGSPFLATFEMKPLGHGQALDFKWWQMYLKGRDQPFVAVGCVCVWTLGAFYPLFQTKLQVDQWIQTDPSSPLSSSSNRLKAIQAKAKTYLASFASDVLNMAFSFPPFNSCCGTWKRRRRSWSFFDTFLALAASMVPSSSLTARQRSSSQPEHTSSIPSRSLALKRRCSSAELRPEGWEVFLFSHFHRVQKRSSPRRGLIDGESQRRTAWFIVSESFGPSGVGENKYFTRLLITLTCHWSSSPTSRSTSHYSVSKATAYWRYMIWDPRSS